MTRRAPGTAEFPARTALGRVARSLFRNLEFALAMAERDLKGKNRGALLGVAWAVLRPFIQTACYVAIVSFIFSARISPESGPYDYALYVLSGLIGWQILQRALEDSTSIVRERMDLLKQVIYPIETLPVTAMASSLIGPAVAIVVYLIVAAIAGSLTWMILLLPVAIALLLILVIGCAWILMLVGTIVRDIRDVVGLVMSLGVYFSPVLLSPQMVGERLWWYVLLNPLAHPVIVIRDVLQGSFHPYSWIILAVSAFAVAALGAWLVDKTKLLINEYI
jgi:lipopolysaccharide transport system permease protein